MTVELSLPPLPMSAEEFERLPEVDGVRFELEEGNLLVLGTEGHRYEVRRTATVKELAASGW